MVTTPRFWVLALREARAAGPSARRARRPSASGDRQHDREGRRTSRSWSSSRRPARAGRRRAGRCPGSPACPRSARRSPDRALVRHGLGVLGDDLDQVGGAGAGRRSRAAASRRGPGRSAQANSGIPATHRERPDQCLCARLARLTKRDSASVPIRVPAGSAASSSADRLRPAAERGGVGRGQALGHDEQAGQPGQAEQRPQLAAAGDHPDAGRATTRGCRCSTRSVHRSACGRRPVAHADPDHDRRDGEAHRVDRERPARPDRGHRGAAERRSRPAARPASRRSADRAEHVALAGQDVADQGRSGSPARATR